MKNRYLFSAVVIVAILSITAIWGCRSKPLTIETDEGKITLKHDEGLKIKTSDATISINQGTLPDNLSKDIPIYSPSDVAMSQVLKGGKNIILALSTKDDSSKVKKFYEDEMSKKGWNINRKMSMGPAFILAGNKGKSELNVTLNQENDKTIISLAYQEK